MDSIVSRGLLENCKAAVGKFSKYTCVQKVKDMTAMDRVKKLLSPGTKRKHINNGHKTFGVPIEELTRKAPSGCKVPFVVNILCDFITNNGIEQEGIFRVSGSSRVVEKVKNSFDQTGDADLAEDGDIMAVASVLKLFLRELPDSVIPEHMTRQFIAVEEAFSSVRKGASYLQQMKRSLGELPEEHYDLLKYLMSFLVLVSHFEASNKMSPMALAIVFGPNIFRCGFGIAGLKDQGVTNRVVCSFISDYITLFKVDGETSPRATKFIKVQESKIQKTPPPRPPPPRIGESAPAPVAPPRKSKMRYDSSQYQDQDDLNNSDDSHSGVGTPRSRNSNTSNPFISPRLSDDESGRTSPFILDSDNGHSIMDSPIVPAVASEIVEHTINQAISEYMFGSEADVSTTASSMEEMTRDSLENETSVDEFTPDSLGQVKAPIPAPRRKKSDTVDGTVDKENSCPENSLSVSVAERAHMFQRQHGGQMTVSDSALMGTGTLTNKPKKHRPTSDAFEYFESQGIVIGSKGAVQPEQKADGEIIMTNLSDGVSTNSSLHLLFSNSSTAAHIQQGLGRTEPSLVTNIDDLVDERSDLETVNTTSQTLASFKRVQGPKNRRSPSRKVRKALNLDELDSDIQDLLVDNSELQNEQWKNELNHGHNHLPYKYSTGFHGNHFGEQHNNNNISPSLSPDNNRKPLIPPLDFSKLHEQLDGKEAVPAIEGRSQIVPRSTVVPLGDSSSEEEEDCVEMGGAGDIMASVVLSPRAGVQLKKSTDSDLDLHLEAPLSPSAFKTSLTFSVPSNTDIPPSPPVEQGHYLKHSGPPEENLSTATKQIQRKIQWWKRRVKHFEESFEKENGVKPSHGDKTAHPDVKKYLVEITKAKKELKKLKEEAGSSRSRHSSGAKSDDGSQESNPSTPSVERTLDALLKRLKEKRKEGCRPEDPTLMNKEQIQEEKLAVQKSLLHFESIHGRPASRREKDIMRPLYDRYRTIKRLLSKPMSPRDAELQTVPEDLPFELEPSSGHSSDKWMEPLNIPTGIVESYDDDLDDREDFGTSDFMVTRDLGLLRDTVRPITIERKDSPKVKRKVLEETADTGENTWESNLHELSMSELHEDLRRTRSDKKQLRKVLRNFEDDFFQEYGRKIQKEDRQPYFNEYLEYKQIKARLRLLEALLSKYTPSSAV